MAHRKSTRFLSGRRASAHCVSRGLTTKRVSDSLSKSRNSAPLNSPLPRAPARLPVRCCTSYHISLSRVASRVPSAGPDAPNGRRIPLFLSPDDSLGIRARVSMRVRRVYVQVHVSTRDTIEGKLSRFHEPTRGVSA